MREHSLQPCACVPDPFCRAQLLSTIRDQGNKRTHGIAGDGEQCRSREERLSVALPGMFLVRGRLVGTLQIISAREWSGIDAKDLMRSGALSSLCLHAGIGNNGRDGATECWLVKAISPRVLFTLSNRPYFFPFS